MVTKLYTAATALHSNGSPSKSIFENTLLFDRLIRGPIDTQRFQIADFL